MRFLIVAMSALSLANCLSERDVGDCGMGIQAGDGCEYDVGCGELGEDFRGGIACTDEAGLECTCIGSNEPIDTDGENFCSGTKAELALRIRDNCQAQFRLGRDFCIDELDGTEAQCDELSQD